MKLPRHLTVEKHVGETPLVALERLRSEAGIPSDIPLAYAGRLDPMASGKLVILIGDECKMQERYHALDKEYEVEVLFHVRSDTGDVLGLAETCGHNALSRESAASVLQSLVGPIELPYPHFSARTVKGKPLHMWTLEGRLDEIEIPLKRSRIYALAFRGMRTIEKPDVIRTVRKKIETIPPVTDPKKALGVDFRREAVRRAWDRIQREGPECFEVLSFRATVSSGTYMRSLGELIARRLRACGLAYSIHRTRIGKYVPLTKRLGFWVRQY